MKKRFCLLLAAVLALLVLCPIAAVADASGTYESFTYTYDSATKTLTLSGTAQMKSLTNFEKEMKNRGITDVETLKIEEGVKSGYLFNAMNSCSYPHIIMPKSYLMSLPRNNAFMNCGLKDVVMDTPSIPIHAFTFTDFNSVELLPGLKKVGEYGFYWVKIKDHLILPEGLEQVDDNGFLVYVDWIFACRIPDSLTDIGKDAFAAPHDNSGAVLYVESAVIPENAYSAEKTYIAHLNGGDIKDRAAKMQNEYFETPIKEGFRFGGWYDNPDCEGKPIKRAFLREMYVDDLEEVAYYTVTKLDPAVHVYAKWVTGDEPTPATGDSARLGLWLLLALVSGGAVAAVCLLRRKRG